MDYCVHIIAREESARLGIKRYFTALPCKRGNIAERMVNGNHCLCHDCKAAKSKRDKAHRDKNPGYMKEYREANRDKFRSYNKRYAQKNRDEISAKRRERYLGEIEKERARKARYAPRRRLVEAEWRQANPEKVRAKREKREAALARRAQPFDSELLEFCMQEAEHLKVEREKMSGFPWQIDHAVPLAGDRVSGLHYWGNIQVIPALANQRKAKSDAYSEPFEWMALI